MISDVCETFRPRGVFTVTWESCSGPKHQGMLEAIGQRDKTCNQKAWNGGENVMYTRSCDTASTSVELLLQKKCEGIFGHISLQEYH